MKLKFTIMYLRPISWKIHLNNKQNIKLELNEFQKK